MTKVHDIRVEISDIKADAYYYSFGYKIYIGGKLHKEGTYENDHAWHDDVKGFKKYLRDYGALKIALEQIKP